MAKIPRTKVYNPQKAEAYVGKGVLRNGDTLSPIKGAITPVPNGHLIKKDGTSLKKGGKIKCWTGYVKKGTKKKGGKTVNNCVKKVMKDGGSTPAWTRKEGKNPTGGLNAKGRASYNRANPGSNLKAPQPQGGARKRSFCARSAGQMKMWPKAAKDPNSRLRLARKKWKC
jgi:hypothetical protein